MSFNKTNMVRFQAILPILILITLLAYNNIASAGTHEIGIGASYINHNEDFKKGYGFNIHYDYSPNDFFALRTSINGDYLNRETSVRGDWVRDFFSVEVEYFILSIEESMLFKTTFNKFEPYMGFGISYYFVNHNLDNLKHLEVIENSLGLNIRGGFKYPLTSKLFTSFEAKYALSINSIDNTVRYGTFSYGGGVIIQSYIVDGTINLNRLAIRAGLSFIL